MAQINTFHIPMTVRRVRDNAPYQGVVRRVRDNAPYQSVVGALGITRHGRAAYPYAAASPSMVGRIVLNPPCHRRVKDNAPYQGERRVRDNAPW